MKQSKKNKKQKNKIRICLYRCKQAESKAQTEVQTLAATAYMVELEEQKKREEMTTQITGANL